MPPKRPRYSFVLRPASPAEFAKALMGLASLVDGSLAFDLGADGASIGGIDAAQICMARMLAPESAFVEYRVEGAIHLEIPCEHLKRALKGTTGEFLIYQTGADPDGLIVEKIGSGARWRLGLSDNVATDAFVAPITTLAASHSYDSGPEMVSALADLKSALADDDGSTAGSVAFVASARSTRWIAKCGVPSSARKFQQLLKVGASDVRRDVDESISARYLLSFLQIAAGAKGPATIEFVNVPTSEAPLFRMRLEARARDVEISLFLAPKIRDADGEE